MDHQYALDCSEQYSVSDLLIQPSTVLFILQVYSITYHDTHSAKWPAVKEACAPVGKSRSHSRVH